MGLYRFSKVTFRGTTLIYTYAEDKEFWIFNYQIHDLVARVESHERIVGYTLKQPDPECQKEHDIYIDVVDSSWVFWKRERSLGVQFAHGRDMKDVIRDLLHG